MAIVPENSTYDWPYSKGWLPILNPYLAFLETRVQDGCWNGNHLWREIVQQCYLGSNSQVSKLVTWRRRQPSQLMDSEANQEMVAILLPPVKEMAILLSRQESVLDDHDHRLLNHLKQHRQIEQIHEIVQSFSKIIHDGLSEILDVWLKICSGSGIGSFEHFADGLIQDYAAVRAALEYHWSNGQTEGQINRLVLKRQMYGRHKLDLLRKRVIYKP